MNLSATTILRAHDVRAVFAGTKRQHRVPVKPQHEALRFVGCDHRWAKKGFGWDTSPWVWVVEFEPAATPAEGAPHA